jgi:hypothetical protein
MAKEEDRSFQPTGSPEVAKESDSYITHAERLRLYREALRHEETFPPPINKRAWED